MGRARVKLVMEMDGDALVASLDFEFEDCRCVDEREALPGRVLRIYRASDLMRVAAAGGAGGDEGF